jgi:hypothetical protein
MLMRSAVFWGVTRRPCPVKMGPIRCPETSVNNYHTTPRNIPEERNLRIVFFSVVNCLSSTDTEMSTKSCSRFKFLLHDNENRNMQSFANYSLTEDFHILLLKCGTRHGSSISR